MVILPGCLCCECTCPPCDDGVTLAVDFNGAPYESTCYDGVYSIILGCAGAPPGCDADNTHGGLFAELYCEPDQESPHGIIWRVTVASTFANFGDPNADSFNKFCTKTYTGSVEAGNDCLPVSGEVDLTLDSTDDGGACDRVGTPTATVQRA